MPTVLSPLVLRFEPTRGQQPNIRDQDTVEAITSAAWLQLRLVTAVDAGLDMLALGCLCPIVDLQLNLAFVHTQLDRLVRSEHDLSLLLTRHTPGPCSPEWPRCLVTYSCQSFGTGIYGQS